MTNEPEGIPTITGTGEQIPVGRTIKVTPPSNQTINLLIAAEQALVVMPLGTQEHKNLTEAVKQFKEANS